MRRQLLECCSHVGGNARLNSRLEEIERVREPAGETLSHRACVHNKAAMSDGKGIDTWGLDASMHACMPREMAKEGRYVGLDASMHACMQWDMAKEGRQLAEGRRWRRDAPMQSGPIRSNQVQSGPIRSNQVQSGPIRCHHWQSVAHR